jgi:hypothetical protein
MFRINDGSTPPQNGTIKLADLNKCFDLAKADVLTTTRTNHCSQSGKIVKQLPVFFNRP